MSANPVEKQQLAVSEGHTGPVPVEVTVAEVVHQSGMGPVLKEPLFSSSDRSVAADWP